MGKKKKGGEGMAGRVIARDRGDTESGKEREINAVAEKDTSLRDENAGW